MGSFDFYFASNYIFQLFTANIYYFYNLKKEWFKLTVRQPKKSVHKMLRPLDQMHLVRIRRMAFSFILGSHKNPQNALFLNICIKHMMSPFNVNTCLSSAYGNFLPFFLWFYFFLHALYSLVLLGKY